VGRFSVDIDKLLHQVEATEVEILFVFIRSRGMPVRSCGFTARSVALATGLAVSTGNEPRTTKRPGTIRVEVGLPADLSDTRWRAILAVLADADRYGHVRAQRGAVVWVEIDQEQSAS
jgi:hypothetical protein